MKIQKSILIILFIILQIACKKESVLENPSSGKLKTITQLDSSQNVIVSFELFYSNDQLVKLYVKAHAYIDTINILFDLDSNILFKSTQHLLPTYKVYVNERKITQINIVDSTGLEIGDQGFLWLNDSLVFARKNSGGIIQDLQLDNFYYLDSNYRSSSISYWIGIFTRTYYNYSASFEYLNNYNSSNIPFQFPYDGIDENGYKTWSIQYFSPVYFLGFNGYYVFKPNKNLIKSVNNIPYQYVFNQADQVIELRNVILGNSSLKFEYN